MSTKIWEYKVTKLDYSNSDLDVLNQLGKQGWEAVSWKENQVLLKRGKDPRDLYYEKRAAGRA